MKSYVYNIGYFIVEMFRNIKANPMSNLFSVIGTGLILFLLGLVTAGGAVGENLVTQLEREAQINAYFNENIDASKEQDIVDNIINLDGVMQAQLIDETQAKELMKEVLGEEADILELFDYNPFEAFVEIDLDINTMDETLKKVESLEGIEFVRDNREVLNKIKKITEGLKVVGLIILVAVGITTLIILTHMIRQGIYNNRDQINTMRLLGAPRGFIGLPFLLTGVVLTMLGGLIATGGLILLIDNAYEGINNILMFLPLPPKEEIISLVVLIIPVVSMVLGIIGSLFGISSIRKTN